MREQQRRSLVLAVRCACCAKQRSGSTAPAFGEVRFEVPPWADESARYRPGEPMARMDECAPRWRFFPIRHETALAALRAGRGENVAPAVANALGYSSFTTPRDRAVARSEALRTRVSPRIDEHKPTSDRAPSSGVELGPCPRCKHRPRLKLRGLYAAAVQAERSGGSSVYV